MNLSVSASLVPRLELLESCPSTNDELRRRATATPGNWPDLSLIITDDQTDGKGRLGREWVAPSGSSLAISLLLRPDFGGAATVANALGWIPLLAGLAMTRAVRSLDVDARLKWPNDVLVGGRKVSGILCELLPEATGVIVGAGLNIAMSAEQLPVDSATSLALEGAKADPDAALAAFLREFIALYRSFAAFGGDPEESGLRDAVTAMCDTVGRSVRVHLPDASLLTGTAVEIDDGGRLVVESSSGLTAVAAGDVTHLRY